jgi:hypothetical protein
MRKVVICTILLLGAPIANAQIKFEAQIGGSNFIGLTLNTAYDIQLSKSGNHFIVPSLGVGITYGGDGPIGSVTQVGLNYRYKNWGLGAEVSGFTSCPLLGQFYFHEFADVMIYPNANYTFRAEKKLYIIVSAGLNFALYEEYHWDEIYPSSYHACMLLPGIGLSVGHKF